MRPYGESPNVRETREDRPRSGMTDHNSAVDRQQILSGLSVRNHRRRLKKRARQQARREIDK